MSASHAVPRVVTATTVRVVPGTRHAWHVALRADAGACRFAAGQAMMIARHDREPRRPYSVASAPADLLRDGTLEFLVAVGEDGQPGDHLAGLRPGDLVDIEGPVGAFTLGRLEAGAQVVFLAGGTGIAPLRAMWRQALQETPGRRLTILYSARTQGHVAFADELAAMARAGAADVIVTLTREDQGSGWSGRRGRVDGALVAAVADRRSHAFVCGPPAFVSHLAARLREAGVDPSRTHVEGW